MRVLFGEDGWPAPREVGVQGMLEIGKFRRYVDRTGYIAKFSLGMTNH